MITLTDRFIKILADQEADPDAVQEIVRLVFASPVTPERIGLQAYLYHEGIGVPVDLDKSFQLAEKAANENDGLGCFLLGYMCDNAETPDQAEGGPRQKYDHYDAERFYERCANIDSRWREPARLWLGDYYMDMAQGGDPDIGVEYYESIAENNSEAAGKLSDYYWNLIMPEYFEDEEWSAQLFKWTTIAARLSPEDYSYRMGWIYADGIGCEKSFDKAVDYFSEAYICGNWKGAEAIAALFESFMEEHPNQSEADRAACEANIKKWKTYAEEIQPYQAG